MPKDDWKDIKDAPKTSGDDVYTGPWIMGINRFNEQRVIRWTTEYPSDGMWMFAYVPNDYIAGIQSFDPTEWKELSDPPVRDKGK